MKMLFKVYFLATGIRQKPRLPKSSLLGIQGPRFWECYSRSTSFAMHHQKNSKDWQLTKNPWSKYARFHSNSNKHPDNELYQNIDSRIHSLKKTHAGASQTNITQFIQRAPQINVTQFKAKTNQKQKSHVYTIRSTPILFLFNSKETGYGPLETLKT